MLMQAEEIIKNNLTHIIESVMTSYMPGSTLTAYPEEIAQMVYDVFGNNVIPHETEVPEIVKLFIENLPEQVNYDDYDTYMMVLQELIVILEGYGDPDMYILTLCSVVMACLFWQAPVTHFMDNGSADLVIHLMVGPLRSFLIDEFITTLAPALEYDLDDYGEYLADFFMLYQSHGDSQCTCCMH